MPDALPFFRSREEQTCLGSALLLFLVGQLIEFILIQIFSDSGYQGLCRLDCTWYAGIAESGYHRASPPLRFTEMQNWAFFPLFPMAVRAVASLFSLRHETASILTSKLFFLLSIYAFIKLGKGYLPSSNVLAIGAIAALNPYSIYGNAGYTESLFLLLTCLFFIQLRSARMVPAGMAGMLVSATRLVGICAVASHLITILEEGSAWPKNKRLWAIFGLLLIPVGLLVFMVHLKLVTGDPLAFVHIQYAWRGESPSLTPWNWIISLEKGFTERGQSYLYPYFSLTGLVVLGTACFFLCHKPFRSLALFTLLGIIVPLMSDVWALPRYVWWQAPVLLVVAGVCTRRRSWLLGWLALSLVVNVACYRQWFSPMAWLIS